MEDNINTAKLYIGIDIHKRSWKIKTATDLFDGKSFTCPADSLALKKWVDKHYCAYRGKLCLRSWVQWLCLLTGLLKVMAGPLSLLILLILLVRIKANIKKRIK